MNIFWKSEVIIFNIDKYMEARSLECDIRKDVNPNMTS